LPASTNNQSTPGTAARDRSYELALDDQAQQLIELKQKLTYFLISASAVTIAFVVNFLASHLSGTARPPLTAFESLFVVTSSILGLLGAGASLLSLHLGHASYTRHLRYRSAQKGWNELSTCEQESWDRINAWARRLVTSAFCLLFAQVFFAVGFFVAYTRALTK
jgi:hypothetical protein